MKRDNTLCGVELTFFIERRLLDGVACEFWRDLNTEQKTNNEKATAVSTTTTLLPPSMGQFISMLLDRTFGNTKARILLLGLDAAGKTTILYKLKLGEMIHTIPTIGFNVETVQYKNASFTVWDIGGQNRIRPLWRHYFVGTDALIWVVDSADRERIDEAAEELSSLLHEAELNNCRVLVLANKQDLPNAMSLSEITEKLRLADNSSSSRKWFVQRTVASTGEGLFEGLDWLATSLRS